MTENIECLDSHENNCEGDVEYRIPLSPSGQAFPRCARHFKIRLDRQARIRRFDIPMYYW